MEYEVITSNTYYDFAQDVQDYDDEGWKPVGSMAMTWAENHYEYAILMVRDRRMAPKTVE